MGAVNATSSGFESSRLSPESVVGISSVGSPSGEGVSVVEGSLESGVGWLLKSAQVNCAEIVDTLECLFAYGVIGATCRALWRRLVRLPIAGDI